MTLVSIVIKVDNLWEIISSRRSYKNFGEGEKLWFNHKNYNELISLVKKKRGHDLKHDCLLKRRKMVAIIS